MARRSDFAQKLLDDLRLRKERLAASQNSNNAYSRGADAYTNSRQTFRTSTHSKVSMKSTTTPTRTTGSQKSLPSTEASNQIVPFTGSRGTKPMGDLSMALAFAMESGGKLRRMDSSRSNNPMLSFLHEISRGSMDVSGHRSTIVQVPVLSQLHVKEISKGAQKLNQILRAWSNGLNFDQSSIEIAKELLKGAIDLEESLRMLGNLQETSLEFSSRYRQQNRLVLLEEGEDDEGSIVKGNSNEMKQIELPRFSFDKQGRRDRGIQQSVGAIRNTAFPALTYPNESSKFSISNLGEQKSMHKLEKQKPVKERKTNVIAKLMGLEEFPENDAAAYKFNKGNASDAILKTDGTLSLISLSSKPERANKSPLSQEISRMMMGSGRKVAAPNVGATEVKLMKKPLSKKPENFRPAASDGEVDDGMLKEQRTISKSIHTGKNKRHEQVIEKSPDQRSPKVQKSMRTIEIASTPNTKQEIGQKLRRKTGNKEVKQQRDDQNVSLLHDHSQKPRIKFMEEKHQHIEKKRGDAKHKDGSAFMSKTSPNAFQKPNAFDNKKSFAGKNRPENLVPTEFIDIAQFKGHEDRKTEQILTQNRTRFESMRGDVQTAQVRERRVIPASTPQRAKVAEQLGTEKFQMINEVGKIKGGLVKDPMKTLPWYSHSQGLQKIKLEKILNGSAKIEQGQTYGSENTESMVKLQKEAEHSITAANEDKMRCHELNKVILSLNPDQRDQSMLTVHVTDTQSQAAIFHADYQGLRPVKANSATLTKISSDQEILQTPIQEKLTESENHIKRVVLRSQLFIDTAEALFDLNIPPTTIYASDRDPTKDHTYSDLILDCGYEISKRKGRLQELSVHPFMKLPIGFMKVLTLDDLIKQLSDSFERLKLHGRNGNPKCEAEEYLPRMLESDIDARDPEINCMWDFGWNCMVFAFLEKDEVVRNVEKLVIGGLIDEIASDLLQP